MAGFVYIFSNPAFDRIKIGKSTKDPTIDRLKEMNRETGNPEPYECPYYVFVGNENGLERAVHEKFSDQRPNSKREFFEVSISEAIDGIRIIAPDFGGIKYEEGYYLENELNDIKSQQDYYEEIITLELDILPDVSDLTPNLPQAVYERLLDKARLEKVRAIQAAVQADILKAKTNILQKRKPEEGSKHLGQYKNERGTWSQHHRLADGSEYFGEFEAGKRHGHGRCKYANGDVYVGKWKASKRHGHGTLYLENGNWYVGGWELDEWHGHGVYKYHDGSYYDGEYKHGSARGKGKFFHANGSQGATTKRMHKKMKR